MFVRGARRQAETPAAASHIPQRLPTEGKLPTFVEVLPAEQQAHARGSMLSAMCDVLSV